MTLRDLLERLQFFQLNTDEIILQVIQDRERDVVRYVTEMQLFMEGLRGEDGAFLMDVHPYHPYTIQVKMEKGQPTDRVTLRDTGDFHDSFFIEYGDAEFLITASDWKTEELMEKYGEGIMALSDENLKGLRSGIIRPGLLEKLKETIYENSG